MKSIPDAARDDRRAWLDALPRDVPASQSDVESSAVWRWTFVAAFIVIIINIPASPPVPPAAAHVRSTV